VNRSRNPAQPGENLFPLGATDSSSTFGSGRGGNPDLLPIKTRNLDLSAEWYFSNRGSVTITGFYRNLQNYVQSYVETELFPTGPGGALQTYAVTRPRNTAGGELNGLELAGEMFFGFLPEPLSGFGIRANFTYSDGEVKAPGQPGVMQDILQVSRYSYNIVGFHENYGLTARLAHNWRSKQRDF
jgi:TonB-dependent receptor